MLGALVLLLVIYLIIDGALGFPIGSAASSSAANGYKAGRDERRRQIDAQLNKSKKGKRILLRRQRNRAVRAAVWQAVRDGAVSGWDSGADRRAKQWAWVQTTTQSGAGDLFEWLQAAREQLSKIGLPEPDGADAPGGEPSDGPPEPAPQQTVGGPHQGPQQDARGPQQAPAPDPQQPVIAGSRPPEPAPAPTPATAGSAIAIRPAQPSSRPPRPVRPQPASTPLPNRPDEILAATVRSENVREDHGSMQAGQRVTCREHGRYRKDCCNKAAVVA